MLLLLPLACGCAGLGSYFSSRLDDLGDCVRARASLGVGLYAEVDATSAVRPSMGFIDVTLVPRLSIGWDPRPHERPGQTRTAAFPALLIGWPYYGYDESASGYGDTHPYLRGAAAPWVLMGNHHVEGRTRGLLYLDRLIGNPRLEPYEPNDNADNGQADEGIPTLPLSDHFWFSVSATVVVPSFDLGINPAELLDWLCGWFGIDFLSDDNRD